MANLCSDSLGGFSRYWESSYKGDKTGLIIPCVGLEIRKTRAPNPAPSFCHSGQGLTYLSFRFFLCRRDLPVRALPQSCVREPSRKAGSGIININWWQDGWGNCICHLMTPQTPQATTSHLWEIPVVCLSHAGLSRTPGATSSVVDTLLFFAPNVVFSSLFLF